MTPKEKAEDLYQKFLRYAPAAEEFEHEHTKQCALVSVDELIKECTFWFDTLSFISTQELKESLERLNYWQEVKQEIEKL